MHVVPCPDPDDVPYNDAVSKDVPSGSKLTATFQPAQRTTEFVLPTVAVSKRASTTYEVHIDGDRVFGPAPIPPTDIDDLTTTFLPARRFTSELKVIVRNLSTGSKHYTVQAIGWEVAGT